MDTNLAKQAVREHIWTLLEREHAVPPGASRRIPAFIGADKAADRLAELSAWDAARVIKTVPDTAQLPVRVRALREGKLVYMAVPRLATQKPFYLLDPTTLPAPPVEAAKKDVAAQVARTVDVDEISPVEMVVLGSVAVNRHGARLGKGAGYSDIELAILQEAGLIGEDTIIVTTVHQLQVIDEPIPEAEHDFRMDLIVTPQEVIWCDEPRRPNGLLWESLPSEKIGAIPALAARRASRRR
ncbi:5-formyltetrahydrofolate cyclo-ligase [Nocardia transvalensis]|uniref:5-formyltetrahydrofolate cyclo-ligase n=1 Tax=Nocardia transvalensis TaxID=37333 RepID=UPI001894FE97|nr:5-formyltetrahydrofolate cyclo-ligase [Nocardia transvalensis]MBF6330881.1 5-formyltetrahydrofolate cyclo-ligase [Nocardia transvalensis]